MDAFYGLAISLVVSICLAIALFINSRKQRAWLQKLHLSEVECARLSSQDKLLDETKSQLQEKQQHNDQLQRALAARSDVITELETRLEAERNHHQEKLQLLDTARDQLTIEFQNLANRIFDSKTERFDAQSKNQLGSVLNPLKEQIGEFKRQIEDSYHRESKDRIALHQQISQLKQLNQQMSQDALNLTNALKGENKTQGNWGEVILAKVLEQSGLRQGFEFETQVSLSVQGKRYQPDVIVHLPDGKDIIVDSKVSLLAYEKYCNSENDEVKHHQLQAHIQSIRGHIRGLSDKAYQKLEGVRTLDFVLLFIPVEGAFLLALEQQPELFDQAFERNILLVSPATLLVTLRTIHHIWRNEYQHQNAEEIAKRGGELYDKFVGFTEVLDDLGRHIDKSQQAYELAYKRMASGRGNLVSQAARLEQLGAAANKKLAKPLVDAAQESDVLEVKA